MRIDFHIHLAIREQLTPAAEKFCDGFWEGRGDWDERVRDASALDALVEAEGLDYAVGLAEVSPITTGITSNDFVYERFGSCRKVFLFANLNPYFGRSLGDEVHRLADLGFRGLKLYPTYQHFYANDAALYPMYQACAERGWPVMVHTGSSIFTGAKIKYGDPIYLDDVVVDFPKLNVLAVHGGRGLWYERAAFLAQLHPNFYIEVAGLPPKNLPKYFPNLDKIGHKIVFGSDWPGVPGIRENMEEIAKLPLSSKNVDNILGLTAAKLLHL